MDDLGDRVAGADLPIELLIDSDVNVLVDRSADDSLQAFSLVKTF